MKSYAQKFAEKKDGPVAVKPAVVKAAVVKAAVAVKTDVVPEVPRDGPWTKLGVTETEYKVSRQRIQYNLLLWEQQQRAEIQRQGPSDCSATVHFWKMRRNMLENERQKLNRRAGWSATDAADADYLDGELSIAEYYIYSVPYDYRLFPYDTREVEEADWFTFSEVKELNKNIDVSMFCNHIESSTV